MKSRAFFYAELLCGFTPLMEAACSGRTSELSALSLESTELDQRDVDGRTALWFASNRAHTSCVLALLKAGADPDPVDHFGETPVMKSGNLDILRALIEAGADVARKDLLGRPLWAHFRRSPQAMDLLLDFVEPTPILRLWRMYYRRQVRAFEDALVEMLALLDPDEPGFLGRGPVWWATSLGSIPSLNRLHERGSSMDVPDQEGNTPLFEAVLRVKPSVVRWLLQHGADPNREGREGQTALMRAAVGGEPGLLRAFLDCPDTRSAQQNRHGHTALWFARSRGRHAAAELLRERAT